MPSDDFVIEFFNLSNSLAKIGGADQFEPLTIIAVKRTGLARRAGRSLKKARSFH